MNIAELREKSVAELTGIAQQLQVPGATGLRKQDLIFSILRAHSEKNGLSYAEGVLESELFGHERGSFTGAVRALRKDSFIAESGTRWVRPFFDFSAGIVHQPVARSMSRRSMPAISPGRCAVTSIICCIFTWY